MRTREHGRKEIEGSEFGMESMLDMISACEALARRDRTDGRVVRN